MIALTWRGGMTCVINNDESMMMMRMERWTYREGSGTDMRCEFLLGGPS
jgi:hypothetical protein